MNLELPYNKISEYHRVWPYWHCAYSPRQKFWVNFSIILAQNFGPVVYLLEYKIFANSFVCFEETGYRKRISVIIRAESKTSVLRQLCCKKGGRRHLIMKRSWVIMEKNIYRSLLFKFLKSISSAVEESIFNNIKIK